MTAYKDIGVVVQLVRIHACHAWGRGFESRPHRREQLKRLLFLFYLLTDINMNEIEKIRSGQLAHMKAPEIQESLPPLQDHTRPH